ncbi:LysE family translocator [Alkalicoccobacillus murimartini]|uniref:Threonine/homoserine/homoserine lactone efflux protein n=1 Tax=Alkalicoccobacillus murimartini TaxID=171685 RepID=A0ABT9YCP3_9BACI|nr:LysE family translocator [Alkalicoccobacillus murimartini]MDQ0205626.1 threonine/homoserine/homoserine lactone efflux protein [Alkalicoccobacillus murimartini]
MITAISAIVLGISLAAPVGPICLEIINRTLRNGFLGGIAVGIGGMTADALFMAAIYFGLGSLLTHETTQLILYLCGCLFLGFLSIRTFQKAPQSLWKDRHLVRPKKTIFAKCFYTGLMIALINPINIMFWFGIYGSVLSELVESSSETLIIGHSILIFTGILLWNLNLSFLAHFSSFLMKPKVLKWLNFSAASMLAYFSIHFGIQFYYLISS